MAGFGVVAWGGSSWGTGAGVPALAVSAIYPVGSHVIRVEFTTAPEQRPLFAGSALNPDLWSVTRQDTGRRLYVLAVAAYAAPLVFDLLLSEPLGSYNVQHLVVATGVVDPTGIPLDPLSQEVRGTIDRALSSVEQKTIGRKQGIVDLRSAFVNSVDQLGGTFRVMATGDYERESGVSLVRKLIIRRLTTSPGEFYHLPQYGLGFKEKEPLPNSNLQQLRGEIQRQVLREPEVDDASVSLRQYADGNILVVDIKARMRKTGESFAVQVPLQL